MSTTATPPPPPAPPAQPGPGQPGANQPGSPVAPAPGSSRVIAILVIAVGAMVLLGTIVSSAFGTWAAASVHTTTRTLEVDGVTDLDVQVDAGSFRVEFDDVDDAELDVRSAWGIDRWRLEREGDELVVASPRGWLNSWFGGWFGGNGSAVLRLPESLEGMNADLGLAAGELGVDGSFGSLGLEVGAGRADVSGSATSLDADISAGHAEVELDGVRQVTTQVSAGSLEAALTGRAPSEITADVSAGSLRLTVPEGEYDISSEVSAGDFRDGIGSTEGAGNTIRITVSAGEAVLRAH